VKPAWEPTGGSLAISLQLLEVLGAEMKATYVGLPCELLPNSTSRIRSLATVSFLKIAADLRVVGELVVVARRETQMPAGVGTDAARATIAPRATPSPWEPYSPTMIAEVGMTRSR
jgi:hypothetical protein